MKKWSGLILLCILAYGLWVNEAQASIVLKATVVNPSKTKTQTALLKAYLPRETGPSDIVELGDLKVDYDITKGLYYVYKECELAPGESVIRSVEIKDVWVISAAEINALTGRAKEIVERLKKTAYFDTAVNLQKDIETKSDEIIRKQEEAAEALPQTHIAAYRDNVETLNSIKASLARLDDMLLKAKALSPEEKAAAGRVSVQASWWVISAVIITLGILSFIFFIIWHRQATGSAAVLKEKEETEEVPPPEEEEMPPTPPRDEPPSEDEGGESKDEEGGETKDEGR